MTADSPLTFFLGGIHWTPAERRHRRSASVQTVSGFCRVKAAMTLPAPLSHPRSPVQCRCKVLPSVQGRASVLTSAGREQSIARPAESVSVIRPLPIVATPEPPRAVNAVPPTPVAAVFGDLATLSEPLAFGVMPAAKQASVLNPPEGSQTMLETLGDLTALAGLVLSVLAIGLVALAIRRASVSRSSEPVADHGNLPGSGQF
jgi:hypothetical protein